MSNDTIRYIVACGLLGAAIVAQHLMPEPSPRATVKPDWSTLPREIAGWRDEDLPVNRAVAEYLRAQALLTRIYRKGSMAVEVSAVFGTQWRSLHSPAGCFFSQGWQAMKREQITIDAPGNCPHPGPLHAEILVLSQGHRYLAVTYLYAYPGGTTASWVEQCYKVTRGGTEKGGIVVIFQALCNLADVNKMLAAEAELLRALYPYLVEVWYKSG